MSRMNFVTRRRIWGAAATCALLLGLPINVAAAGPHSKLDRHLQKTVKGDSGTYRVIIRAKAGKRGAVAQIVRQRGDAVYGDHSGINGVSVEVSARTLRALAKDPNVESISIDADLDALESKSPNKPASTTSPSTTSPATTTT